MRHPNASAKNCRWPLVHFVALTDREGVWRVDEILFQVLAEGVGRYLDSVDRVAAGAPGPARAELRRMSAAWRAVLGVHRPAGVRRRCSGCERCEAMCTVWRVAAAYFIRRLRS
jgi:hypothetical protein